MEIEIGDIFRTQLRLKENVFYRYKGNWETKRIVNGIAAIISDACPVHTFILLSDQITPEQEKRIVSLLKTGNTLVIGVIAGTRTPAIIADHWEYYCEDPRHTSIKFFRSENLDPIKNEDSLGMMLIVCPESLEVDVPKRARIKWLTENQINKLCQVDIPIKDVDKLGVEERKNGPITIKDLCFLHHRDPPGTPRRRCQEFIENSTQEPLTWTDVQTLLRQQREDRRLPDFLRSNGRISDNQWSRWHTMSNFLEDHAGKKTTNHYPAVHESIYDAWWNHPSLEDGLHVFRGHMDANWRLEPTLFRTKPDGSMLNLGDITDRLFDTEAFISRLKQRSRKLFEREPTDEELLAVAQHYGFPTPLLDYTYSLSVAAFFATSDADRLKPGTEKIGVIYYIRPDRKELKLGSHIGLGDFSLLKQARIHVGNIEIIKPALRGKNNRIDRQKGIFLNGYRTDDLKNVSVDRIYFRQIPGEVYEDSHFGITTKELLPPDSEIAAIAQEVKKETKKKVSFLSSKPLRSTPVQDPSLIGSSGALLFQHIRDSSSFFKSLQNVVQDDFGEDKEAALAGIFQKYFEFSRERADAGTVPNNENEKDQGELEPYCWALEQLAGIFGVEVKWLTDSIENAASSTKNEIPGVSNRSEGIALACGLYISAWEKLQLVDGDTAAKLLDTALFVLPVSNSLPVSFAG